MIRKIIKYFPRLERWIHNRKNRIKVLSEKEYRRYIRRNKLTGNIIILAE